MFLKRVFNYLLLWQTPTDRLIEAITVNVISLPHCKIVFPLQHNENLFVLHFHEVALESSILEPILVVSLLEKCNCEVFAYVLIGLTGKVARKLLWVSLPICNDMGLIMYLISSLSIWCVFCIMAESTHAYLLRMCRGRRVPTDVLALPLLVFMD